MLFWQGTRGLKNAFRDPARPIFAAGTGYRAFLLANQPPTWLNAAHMRLAPKSMTKKQLVEWLGEETSCQELLLFAKESKKRTASAIWDTLPSAVGMAYLYRQGDYAKPQSVLMACALASTVRARLPIAEAGAFASYLTWAEDYARGTRLVQHVTAVLEAARLKRSRLSGLISIDATQAMDTVILALRCAVAKGDQMAAQHADQVISRVDLSTVSAAEAVRSRITWEDIERGLQL